jgi:hypothetical protein
MRFQQILMTRYNVALSAAAEAGIHPFLMNATNEVIASRVGLSLKW